MKLRGHPRCARQSRLPVSALEMRYRRRPVFLFDRPLAAVSAALASSSILVLVDFLVRHVAR
jgi:hypothetical protein